MPMADILETPTGRRLQASRRSAEQEQEAGDALGSALNSSLPPSTVSASPNSRSSAPRMVTVVEVRTAVPLPAAYVQDQAKRTRVTQLATERGVSVADLLREEEDALAEENPYGAPVAYLPSTAALAAAESLAISQRGTKAAASLRPSYTDPCLDQGMSCSDSAASLQDVSSTDSFAEDVSARQQESGSAHATAEGYSFGIPMAVARLQRQRPLPQSLSVEELEAMAAAGPAAGTVVNPPVLSERQLEQLERRRLLEEDRLRRLEAARRYPGASIIPGRLPPASGKHPRRCACGGYKPLGRGALEPYCLERKGGCAVQ